MRVLCTVYCVQIPNDEDSCGKQYNEHESDGQDDVQPDSHCHIVNNTHITYSDITLIPIDANNSQSYKKAKHIELLAPL